MADLNVSKFGKKGVDLSNFNGGLKKEKLKTEEQKSIFNAIDTDKNGIIDEKEMQDFKSKLDKSEDNHVSRREARKFLKENGLKGLSKKEVLNFLQEYAANTENVKSAQVIDEDGQKTVHLEYEDGTQEVINPDKSSRISQTDQNGTSTTRYLDADKKLQKDTISTKEGITTETEYAEDGTTPTIKTVSDSTNGSVSTIVYQEGQPSEKEVKQGSTTSNYTFDEQGNEVLNSRVENQGIPAKEKRTDYTYNEDGTVTVNIKQEGKETVQQLKDGKVQSEVITEAGKTTTIEHAENGARTETINDENGNTSVTQFNADGKKLKQTKTINGTTYQVEYDGNGNTKVVLQNGESIEALAKKFGTTKQEIIKANGGKVRGWAGDDLVVPGELDADAKALQNRDSKEVAQAKYRAFAEEVQRQKDEAKAGLEARKGHLFTWIEKKHNTYEKLARALFKEEGIKNPNKYELQTRIDELKKLNPNIKDGELIGKKVKVSVAEDVAAGISSRQISRERGRQIQQQKQEAKTGSALAQSMHNAIHHHMGGVSEKEFKDALAKVNKNNVVGLVEGYNKLSPDESLLEAIMDETGNTLETRRNAVSKIVNSLIERAKTSGVKDDRTKQMLNDCIEELQSYWTLGIGYCSTEKLDGLVKNIVGAIHASEAMTNTEKTLAAKDNAIDDTLNIMQENVDENSAKLQQQLDEDGWCADLYEGLKWCVGSDNLDENVKADLKKFENSIAALNSARAQGGDQAFKAKFKEIFGVDYDPNLAKGYRKLQTNLANAQALTLQLDGYNKEFASSIQGKESYDVMLNKFGSYMQQVNSEVQDGRQLVEASLTAAMKKDNIDFKTASESQKAQYLRNIIKDTQSGISKQINQYTGGKDLATLENDLKYASTAVFGNKGDLVNRVNSYVSSQQVGGAVVSGAIKAIGAIALAACTGGSGLALLGVAAGTSAISASVDLSDRMSSNVGLKDGEVTNILKNATIDGATVFVGGQVTKAAMVFKSSKAFVQAGGRMLTQVAGDVAVGAGAEYMQTGEITLQGVTFQAVFSAAGNLVALKQLAKGTPSGTTPVSNGSNTGANVADDAKRTLDVATSDGTKMPGGKLGDTKMGTVRSELNDELPSATPERGAQIHQEGDKLQAQSRNQGREIKHMVEDEFGVVTIGKEHIDISTADASTIEKLYKEVSGWSTDTRNKAEILKKLENRMIELHVSPETPNVTRGSEFVDRINSNAQQNASDILAGKQGVLPPHDAAILKEHLTNNLNTVEDVENFMDALKKRVGVDEKGNMHTYEVQGVDQAAEVMKSAEAKLAQIKARQADVTATNSAADAAITGSRGLNEQELATIKSFVERTDSAEDLQALIKKFEDNKCLRNSQASKKLLKTMKEKSEILQAKVETPVVATSESQGIAKPQETYENSHHIKLDRAPSAAMPEGQTADFTQVQRQLAAEQGTTPVKANNEVAETSTAQSNNNIETPKGSVDSPKTHWQEMQEIRDKVNSKALGQMSNEELLSSYNTLRKDMYGSTRRKIGDIEIYSHDNSAELSKLKAEFKNRGIDLERLQDGNYQIKSQNTTSTAKVSKEAINSDVKAISDAEIPSPQRKLWIDCKQRIADITSELSVSFKGNKAAMAAKCKTLFADLKTISATASASVKTKINNLVKKLRTMIDESGLSSNQYYDVKDYTKAKVGTYLPKGEGVLLTGKERLSLANTTLDLNSPQVKSVLDKMKKGDVITVGREGDIIINDATNLVSRKHLTIEKTDNGFIVKDTSTNGTSIAAKRAVRDSESIPRRENVDSPKTHWQEMQEIRDKVNSKALGQMSDEELLSSYNTLRKDMYGSTRRKIGGIEVYSHDNSAELRKLKAEFKNRGINLERLQDGNYQIKSQNATSTANANVGTSENKPVQNVKIASDGLPEINENELVRNVGNNGKPINPKYIKTSREARQYLNESIESGSYTKSLDSYIETMNDMHVVSAKGKSGNDFWYNEAGQGGIAVNPGVIRGRGEMFSPRYNQAKTVEDIAKRYGDPYRVPTEIGTSIKVRLKGIPDKYLPECKFDYNPGNGSIGYYHVYPDGKSLKSYYYKEMYRTSKEALELINNGAPKDQILGKLAEHYQYAANARPYGQINNSLFMNELNTLLSKAGLKTIPHGELDIAAQRLQPNTFKKYFIDQYNKTALDSPKINASNSQNANLYVEVEPDVRVADEAIVLGVEPANSNKIEVFDMDNTPVLTGKFKNFSKQIDNATTLKELYQIENSIKLLNNSPQKKALLNKINEKRAELNNNNQFVYEAQINDGIDYQQQQRLQDDLNNQFVADYILHDQMNDDLYNMNNDIDGMF